MAIRAPDGANKKRFFLFAPIVQPVLLQNFTDGCLMFVQREAHLRQPGKSSATVPSCAKLGCRTREVCPAVCSSSLFVYE